VTTKRKTTTIGETPVCPATPVCDSWDRKRFRCRLQILSFFFRSDGTSEGQERERRSVILILVQRSLYMGRQAGRLYMWDGLVDSRRSSQDTGSKVPKKGGQLMAGILVPTVRQNPSSCPRPSKTLIHDLLRLPTACTCLAASPPTPWLPWVLYFCLPWSNARTRGPCP